MRKFHELVDKNFESLDLYTAAITRAHGESHPEAFRVRELFVELQRKVRTANKHKPALKEEFIKLREVTDHYKIPHDVCETYAKVYKMLAELDTAYQEK
ncbi:MAG TPA: iron-sulfur cluster repair di-iron protein, ric [Pseudogracilibacillus sp.]|nr:iron-sulfur cluster repair di-iron protein, ric [Pseudogracilibacillus sp.]